MNFFKLGRAAERTRSHLFRQKLSAPHGWHGCTDKLIGIEVAGLQAGEAGEAGRAEGEDDVISMHISLTIGNEQGTMNRKQTVPA